MALPKYYSYPAILTYEPDQEISVEFPDLNCATSGIDDLDAANSAEELLGLIMLGLEEDGEEIPSPTPLYNLSLEHNQRSTYVTVFMPSVRQAENNRSVNRTVTLPAWMNAKATELGINCSQLLQDAIKDLIENMESSLEAFESSTTFKESVTARYPGSVILFPHFPNSSLEVKEM